MRVLVRRPWELRKECPWCKSSLVIEAGDIKYSKWSCMGESCWNFFVTCPVCEGDISFGEFPTEIPQHIRDKASKE